MVQSGALLHFKTRHLLLALISLIVPWSARTDAAMTAVVDSDKDRESKDNAYCDGFFFDIFLIYFFR